MSGIQTELRSTIRMCHRIAIVPPPLTTEQPRVHRSNRVQGNRFEVVGSHARGGGVGSIVVVRFGAVCGVVGRITRECLFRSREAESWVGSVFL